MADASVVDRWLAVAHRSARRAGGSRWFTRWLNRALYLFLARLEPTMPPGGRRRVLRAALRDAVLADGLVLLPPRQQTVLRWALRHGRTVRQISDRTGWPPDQVIRLLCRGLTTLTVRGESGVHGAGMNHR